MKFDVVVVGGGLVGAAFAVAFAGSGRQIALIERFAPASPLAMDVRAYDQRIYSLTPRVCAWLEDLGIWSQLPSHRIATLRRMRVWGDAGGCIEFDAFDSGAQTLAFVLEQNGLLEALWQRLRSLPNVTLLGDARPRELTWDERLVSVALESDEQLQAQLLVGADGGNSWVRNAAQIESITRAYLQHSIVANFTAEKPHGDTAFQWFRADGVLAWLPLPDQQISIVWSCDDASAAQRMALGDAEFTQDVAEAGGTLLGALTLTTPRASFPLRLLRAAQWVCPRLALIGDAAHSVHPLAGQGVNLGLEDAACLARVLVEGGVQTDLGDFYLLRRYERARKEEVLLMQSTVDALQRLFSADRAWLARVRNAGLTAVGRSGWLKRRLAGHAMS